MRSWWSAFPSSSGTHGSPARRTGERRDGSSGGHHVSRLREVTGDRVSLPALDQGRLLAGTDLLGFPAPGPEPASGRGIGRAGHVTFQDDPSAMSFETGVGHRYGGQEALGVRVRRAGVDVGPGAG